jgi:hypothetical protein
MDKARGNAKDVSALAESLAPANRVGALGDPCSRGALAADMKCQAFRNREV